MAFTVFRDMKTIPQLFFSLFVILVSFLASMVLSFLIALPFFGIEPLMNISAMNDLSNPETIQILKLFQVGQAIGLFIVPPFILGWFYYGNIYEYLFLEKSFAPVSIVLVLLLMFTAAPFVNFIGEINAQMTFPEWLSGVEEWMRDMEENAQDLTETFLKADTGWGLLFNLFMIAFLPAIGEELLFRGVVQRFFTRITHSHNWGIWIAAILFSVLHFQFYGFVPRMLLGVMFGYLLVWSGSMWLPILAHFLNNAFAVIAIYMVDKNLLDPNVEEVGSSPDSYYLAAISLGLIAIFMLMIKRQNEANQLRREV